MEKTLSSAALPGVDIALRRSPRARRLSLRVSRLDGRVTLTVPSGVPQREVERFVQERANWVQGHLADQPAPVVVGAGVVLPVLGAPVRLTARDKARVAKREGDVLWVSAARASAQAKAHIQTVARARLAQACDDLSARLGRRYSVLALRDTRSRWGSCSSTGRLMFSWRLAMAPARILDYVAAHEVAHLAEMNHSAAFWTHVARLHPTYQEDRAWLHAHGARLHRYRFEGAGT